MNRGGYIGLLSAFVALTEAHADDARAPDETIIIIDRAPADPDAKSSARDRDRALGDAPFVTIIHADDHPATTSVADAIGASVGAQSRSLGGLGAYESISVRGAGPGHTSVLVDGIPLARLAGVTTDLGRYTLDAFSEVELYRGAVPVALGGAGVGGALNLVTRLGRGDRGERIRASIGGGSFGAGHARIHHGESYRRSTIETAATLGYQRATGDYSYFSDNGTPLNLRDDSYEIRRNNDFGQLDGNARIGAHDRSWAAGVRALNKRQGLPGSATQPSLAPSLSTTNVIADGMLEVPVGGASARQLGFVVVERQRLRDPDGEIGFGPQDRSYLTLSGGLASTWRAPLGRHEATAGIELRGDRFRDADETSMRAALRGDREAGAVLAALDLALDPAAAIVVTPAVRFDLVRTAPTPVGTGPQGMVAVDPRWNEVASPRISARAALTADVAVKASAGRYVRLPTLVEMFGNRGTIVGAPDLRPERGPSTDIGIVWAPSRALGALDRILVEASAFGTRSRDTIAFVTSLGYVARATNIAASQTYGGEVVASARVARTLAVTANYTRLVTEQLTEEASFANKSLPRQPGHAVYARIDAMRKLRGRRAAIWLDGSWQSTTFLDQANFVRVPARMLAGAGARVEVGAGFAVALSVENALDVRVQQLPLDSPPRPDLTMTPMALADIAGFPLPGRTVYLSLDWSY